MIENLKRFVWENDLIPQGGTVVLGLSGGPDSVCLLYALRKIAGGRMPPLHSGAGGASPAPTAGKAYAFRLVCAHVNHGLRGADSDADEAFVAALCERLSVPLELMRIDAAAVAAETGMGVEEAGRAVRYAFFDEVAERETRPVVIALAHNQDDQAETVLMRILRGTGTDGLAGIPVKRDSAAGFPVVRPLLDTPRWAIEDWLARGGIAYRQDASNLERDAFRNRVRLDALPALEAVAGEGAGACAKQGLLRLARNAAEDRAFFDAVTDRVLLDCEKAGGGAQDGSVLVIPITALAGLHAAVGHRVMVKAFARLGLGRDIAGVHLAAADDLLRKAAHPRETGGATGKRVEFPQDYTFGIERDEKGVLCAVFRAPTARRADWKPRRKQVELDEPL